MFDDFSTHIRFRGNTKDIKKAINEILKYNKGHNDMQIKSVTFNSDGNLINVINYSEEQLDKYIESHNNDVDVSFVGPCGYFAYLEEFPLFKELSKSCGELDFDGFSEGYNPLGYQTYTAIYKNGDLNLRFSHSDMI